MIKYCIICGIEISDTDYDSWYRFIRVKYCTECAEEQRKQAQREADYRYKQKKRLERYQKRWNGWKSDALELDIISEKKKELQQQQEQIKLLKEENKLLRKNNAQLRATHGNGRK